MAADVWIEVSRRSIGPDVEVRLRNQIIGSYQISLPGLSPSLIYLLRSPVVVKVAHDEFREPFVEIYTRGDEGKRCLDRSSQPREQDAR